MGKKNMAALQCANTLLSTNPTSRIFLCLCALAVSGQLWNDIQV